MYITCRSAKAWTSAKRRLAFCEVTQDGDDEGCLRLRELPTPTQAKEIRSILGLRKRLPSHLGGNLSRQKVLEPAVRGEKRPRSPETLLGATTLARPRNRGHVAGRCLNG